ncbi:hypothetical protein CsSME_00000038 [Camellia sinensis var. sinensis]
MKSKTVADVVEALIGAFLSTGGEASALSFMDWLGIKVDFVNIPYERHFPVQAERLVNIKYFESLLNYSFRDPSLLVEALTHGSYMLPEIPGCYQVIFYIVHRYMQSSLLIGITCNHSLCFFGFDFDMLSFIILSFTCAFILVPRSVCQIFVVSPMLNIKRY